MPQDPSHFNIVSLAQPSLDEDASIDVVVEEPASVRHPGVSAASWVRSRAWQSDD